MSQKIKNHNAKRMPKLRFEEFSGKWDKNKLGNIATFFKGKGISKNDIVISGQNKCIRYGELYTEYNELIGEIKSKTNVSKERAFLSEKNDLLIPSSGETALDIATTSCIQEKNILLGGDLNVIRLKNQNGNFLAYYLSNFQNINIAKLAQGNSVVHLYSSSLKSLKINLPSLPEQQKIADFLESTDKWIENLRTQKEALESYKKGMMQKIFSQEIRFKDDDGGEFGEWEDKRLGAVCERITSKNSENNQNVLTISAQQGLINQKKFFTKSVSAKNVSGYYLLKKNDFAYNKSYSNGYPMGALKRLTKYDKGVVSTLYICFRINTINHSNKFFEVYFEAGMLNKEIRKIAQEGARDHGLLNMSVKDFFNEIEILIPSLPEQKKIADFLTSLDNLIEAKQEQITWAEKWKRGLMQNLFV